MAGVGRQRVLGVEWICMWVLIFLVLRARMRDGEEMSDRNER